MKIFLSEILEVYTDKVELLVVLCEDKDNFDNVVKLFPRAELESIVNGMPQYPKQTFIELKYSRENGRLVRSFTQLPWTQELHDRTEPPDYFSDIGPDLWE